MFPHFSLPKSMILHSYWACLQCV